MHTINFTSSGKSATKMALLIFIEKKKHLEECYEHLPVRWILQYQLSLP